MGKLSSCFMPVMTTYFPRNYLSGILTYPPLRVKNSIFIEIGNILLNACMGTIANHIEKRILCPPPELIEKPDNTPFFNVTSTGTPNTLIA